MSSRKVLLLIILIVVVAAAGLWLYRTRKPEPHRAVVPVGTPVQIAAPLGLPPVPVPADNPPTAETIALGRRIYYDPILSVDNTVSCASCHSPAAALPTMPKPKLISLAQAHASLQPKAPQVRPPKIKSWWRHAADCEENLAELPRKVQKERQGC